MADRGGPGDDAVAEVTSEWPVTATSNGERAQTLVRALRAGIGRDRGAITALCTGDVRAWTPAFSTAGVEELLDVLDRRDEAFSELALELAPLDVGGAYACVEWSLSMSHTGRLVLGDVVVEATGLRVAVHGTSVAEFDGERICAVRQYWDELSLLDQLGVLGPPDADPGAAEAR